MGTRGAGHEPHAAVPACCAQVWALNEARAGSVRGVFRPWAERLDMSLPTLDSNDDDPELLIHVPFNGTVKIKVAP